MAIEWFGVSPTDGGTLDLPENLAVLAELRDDLAMVHQQIRDLQALFAQTGTPASPTVSSYAISGPVIQLEGNSGAASFVFTVTRTGATGFAEALFYAVSGTGANPANGADFQGGMYPSGTLSFAAGSASANITVAVLGDTVVEQNETFSLVISNPTAGGIIATNTAIGTILNDDTMQTGPSPDAGCVLLTDPDGAYLTDPDGSYLQEAA